MNILWMFRASHNFFLKNIQSANSLINLHTKNEHSSEHDNDRYLAFYTLVFELSWLIHNTELEKKIDSPSKMAGTSLIKIEAYKTALRWRYFFICDNFT